MKRIPLLLMILLLCSSGIKTNSSLDENGLRGKVKEVRDYIYGYGADTMLYVENASTYDMMGNEAYRKQYAARTSIDLPMIKWTYRYNSDSNKIEAQIYDGDGTLESRTTFLYDHDNNITQTNKYGRDGGLAENCVYEYNVRDRKTACACYSGMGDLKGKWTYTYDTHDNLVQERQDSGKVKSMKYDRSNNLVELKIYKPDEKDGNILMTRYIDIIKDKKGNWIERTEITLHNGISDTMVHKRVIAYY